MTYRENKNRSLVLLGLFFVSAVASLLVALSISTESIQAQESTVRTTLCDPLSGPELQIDSPVSDSLTNSSNVVLGGDTVRTTQLEIYVNGQYSHSIAVEPEGPFNTNVALKKGNNTIRVRAYFSCNQQDRFYNLVVTYVPKAKPSQGKDIDTHTSTDSGDISLSGGDSGGPVSGGDRPQSLEPIIERITNKLISGSEVSHKAINYPYSLIVSWLALVICILALVVLIVPGQVLLFFGLLLGRQRVVDSPTARRSMRVIGLLFLAVAGYFLQM